MGRPDYLYLSLYAGFTGKSGAGGVSHVPGTAVGTGVALLAAESDEALMRRFTPEQWRNLAPHVAQQRQRGYVLWHHADGEVSMAQPLGKRPQRWPLRECGGLMRRRRLRVYRR